MERMMSKTDKNLMDAFAGESQANRKYLAFANQAEKEGLKQVSKLFRAVAEAETIHAHAHLAKAGKVHSTLDNLKDAKEGEVHECSKMYPEMIKEAMLENRKAEEKYFDYARRVEELHSKLYQKAIDAGGKLPEVDYYVCKICGFTHEGPVEICPICNAPAPAFFVVK
jgi:rubrerythrin